MSSSSFDSETFQSQIELLSSKSKCCWNVQTHNAEKVEAKDLSPTKLREKKCFFMKIDKGKTTKILLITLVITLLQMLVV